MGIQVTLGPVKLCSVSVDLDEIPNYFHIHGLSSEGQPAARAVYEVGLERLQQFANDAQLPLTLFAIGADLATDENRARLRSAHAAGHEIANHSLNHRYDLSRLSKANVRDEILGGIQAIEQAVGAKPVGFRAPGYTICDAVYDVLEELGVDYDSSVFPCPAYYAAKHAAIGLIAMRGRRSHSVTDTPAVLTAPTEPYRVGKPYYRRGRGLLEFPIQVTRGLRLPFIGTTLSLVGARGARALARMCVGDEFVNLELHGIDVLSVEDGLRPLAGYQPDVKVPLSTKMAALHGVVETLRSAGYAFVTLEEASKVWRKRV
jgi:hypothetical protein